MTKKLFGQLLQFKWKEIYHSYIVRKNFRKFDYLYGTYCILQNTKNNDKGFYISDVKSSWDYPDCVKLTDASEADGYYFQYIFNEEYLVKITMNLKNTEIIKEVQNILTKNIHHNIYCNLKTFQKYVDA
jgi:hypothetical protein